MTARITISYSGNEFTFERSHYSATYEILSNYKYIPINGKNICFLACLFCFSWQVMLIGLCPNSESWDFPSMSVTLYCSTWSSIRQTKNYNLYSCKDNLHTMKWMYLVLSAMSHLVWSMKWMQIYFHLSHCWILILMQSNF